MQHKHCHSKLTLCAPLEFWLALNRVRNVALMVKQDEYFKHRGLPPIDSFRASLDVVDFYLSRVELDGWLSNDK
jgi:hypothetical protein